MHLLAPSMATAHRKRVAYAYAQSARHAGSGTRAARERGEGEHHGGWMDGQAGVRHLSHLLVCYVCTAQARCRSGRRRRATSVCAVSDEEAIGFTSVPSVRCGVRFGCVEPKLATTADTGAPGVLDLLFGSPVLLRRSKRKKIVKSLEVEVHNLINTQQPLTPAPETAAIVQGCREGVATIESDDQHNVILIKCKCS